MERIKFRQQAERILDRMGHSDVDISFERERLMHPAVLTIYDKDSNVLIDIETPTSDKLEKIINELKNEGKL
jgi:hypothetical protein